MTIQVLRICGMSVSEILQEIDENGKGLTDWEIEFVDSMMRQHTFSTKQIDTIRNIYKEKVPQ